MSIAKCIAWIAFFLFPSSYSRAHDMPMANDDSRNRDAVRTADSFIQLFPKSSFLHWLRGLANEKIGEESKALDDFAEALRLDPKATRVYIDRSNLYRRKGSFDAAIADLNAAIAIKPEHAGLYANRALVWDASLDRDRAIADLNEAIRLNPKASQFFRHRALCWVMKHEPDKAIADANTALAQSNESGPALRVRAQAMIENQDFAGALADLDQLVKSCPDDRSTYLYRSGLHYIRREYALALADLRQVPKASPLAEKWLAAGAEASRTPHAKAAELSAAQKRRMVRGDFTPSQEFKLVMRFGNGEPMADCVGAFNERSSRGVTPQNNAVVPLYEALGPVEVYWSPNDEFYRMLGMKRPPVQGEYLMRLCWTDRQIDFSDPRSGSWNHAAEVWSEFPEALRRPWTKAEFPRLARCLAANRAPLAKIIEASRRPRFYSPVSESFRDLPALSILLPEFIVFRELDHLLTAQATLYLGEGKVDKAWEVTLALFRWSRLLAQSPSTVNHLVGALFHYDACMLTASISHYGGLDRKRLDQLQEELRRVPPFPSFADAVRYETRYIYTDIVQRTARLGPLGLRRATSAICGLSGEPARIIGSDATDPNRTAWLFNESVDWDEVNRLGLLRIEQAARIFEQPTRKQRNPACDDMVGSLHRSEQSLTRSLPFMVLGIIPRDLDSSSVAECLVLLAIPGIQPLCNVEDRIDADMSLARISLSLAAYRADHAAYPEQLAQLVPQYLSEVPKDLFTGGDLHYVRYGKGYRLYSVGPNQKDDGGRGQSDNPPGDDVGFLMNANHGRAK
jgi:tetratricopeptide (TPR) repeat protein